MFNENLAWHVKFSIRSSSFDIQFRTYYHSLGVKQEREKTIKIQFPTFRRKLRKKLNFEYCNKSVSPCIFIDATCAYLPNVLFIGNGRGVPNNRLSRILKFDHSSF